MKKHLDKVSTDYDALADRVERVFGVDLRSYEFPEFVGHIGDVLVPFVMFLRFLGGLILGLIVFWGLVIWIWTPPAEWYHFPLLLPLALVVAALPALAFGVQWVALGFLKNISGIAVGSLNVMSRILVDSEAAREWDTKAVIKSPRPIALLFEASVYVVLLPTLKRVLYKRLKWFSIPFVWVLRKAVVNPLFMLMGPLLEDKSEAEASVMAVTDPSRDSEAGEEQALGRLQKMAQKIEKAKRKTAYVAGKTRFILSLPFWGFSAAAVSFSLVVLYLVHGLLV